VVMPESSSTAGSTREPLLSRSTSSNRSDYSTVTKSTGSLEDNEIHVLLDRSPEADVIPETTVLGRNLGWSSAYILIISRVIGSGIFATPGAITKSVGSVGLSLVLWIVGGLIAWFGLQISLEYGCMLPRSGGESIGNVWLI
jgi:amino acid permease